MKALGLVAGTMAIDDPLHGAIAKAARTDISQSARQQRRCFATTGAAPDPSVYRLRFSLM